MRNNIGLSCFSGVAGNEWPEEFFLGYEESLFDEEAKEEGCELMIGHLSSDRGTEKTPVWAVEDLELEGCNLKKIDHSISDRGTEKMTRCAGEHLKLPDDLVERILGMIPFPNLLKVRTLSRMWYNKFPRPTIETSDGSARRLVTIEDRDRDRDGISSNSFQSQVSSVSAKWSVYCPVVLGDEGLIGYDPTKKRWQGLLIDRLLLLGNIEEPWLICSCGPLICGVSQSPNNQYDVFVTNILTRSWKKLPPHPNRKVPSLLNLIFDSSSGYKVFLVTEEPHEGPYDDCITQTTNITMERSVCAQVFDSGKGTWTRSESIVPLSTSFAWRSCSVHFDESIFCLSGDDRNPFEHPLQLWVYNLQVRKWTEIIHPFGQLMNKYSGISVLFDLTRFKLIVCGSKVMVVLASDPRLPYFDRVRMNSIVIYELEPETRIMTEKSRGPPTTIFASSEHIVSDGASIYFCSLDVLTCSPVVVYNVKSGEWSSLVLDLRTARRLTSTRWADFALQPGLNPFVAP